MDNRRWAHSRLTCVGGLRALAARAPARDASDWTRAGAAADPRLPADLVADLAVDPSPRVRLAVSMRPELTEAERANIEYEVGPADRIAPATWVVSTGDIGVLRRAIARASFCPGEDPATVRPALGGADPAPIDE